MPSETLAPGEIGWYGKLPAAGDFLRHHLPDAFVDDWDAWLRAGMAAAADAQGEDWQDSFLRFPVWYFLRGNDGSGAWAGLLLPGVDRVGRLFPMTVAFNIPPDDFGGLAFAQIETRLAAIEDHTLAALGDDDLERFEEALAALQPLQPEPQDTSATSATPAALVETLGKQALYASLAERAVFWSSVHAAEKFLHALPEPLQADSFCKLVLPAPIPILSE